jgi:hypothetical protein
MHQISKIYFVINLYMFRTSSVSIIRSYLLFSRQLVCFMLCVQQITPDDGHKRCSKHIEFYEKINFGYLMHLVGCFIRKVTWPLIMETASSYETSVLFYRNTALHLTHIDSTGNHHHENVPSVVMWLYVIMTSRVPLVTCVYQYTS